jgi:hypothetical protein
MTSANRQGNASLRKIEKGSASQGGPLAKVVHSLPRVDRATWQAERLQGAGLTPDDPLATIDLGASAPFCDKPPNLSIT